MCIYGNGYWILYLLSRSGWRTAMGPIGDSLSSDGASALSSPSRRIAGETAEFGSYRFSLSSNDCNDLTFEVAFEQCIFSAKSCFFQICLYTKFAALSPRRHPVRFTVLTGFVTISFGGDVEQPRIGSLVLYPCVEGFPNQSTVHLTFLKCLSFISYEVQAGRCLLQSMVL